MRRILLSIFILTSLIRSVLPAQPATLRPRTEYSKSLLVLVDALVQRQLPSDHPTDAGALRCDHCGVLHTRAAEAVYPFAIAHTITESKKYLRAAIELGNWLIRQQQPDGSWKETPEEWTGTTTDQLLMMVQTYPLIERTLSSAERGAWKRSIERAADYLADVMSPEFASINYCATTTASLAATNALLPKQTYRDKARSLAHRVVAKMDEDGFINGEGGKSFNNKFGVDLGYDLEMSLWGLGLYARLTTDTLVDAAVRHSLKNHFSFIYPDGSMDASWGIRSNKWTTYGGATSDGCQVLFSLYADDDPAYVTAALKNLQFMALSMKDGLVGYGPHYWMLFDKPPCIYPTFAKAKNIAMAYALEAKDSRLPALLPTERTPYLKHFRTLDVVQVRTSEFLATITAYRYKDVAAGAKSKYMHRPTGGSVSNLWLRGHGYLTASSQTEYSRPEPMHFPEIGDVCSLTPQITFTDSNGTFTNLYEYDGRIETESPDDGSYIVSTTGELKNRTYLHGGVGYRWRHLFSDADVVKQVDLYYRDAMPLVRIVEPIIEHAGTIIEQRDDRVVRIRGPHQTIDFVLESPHATLRLGHQKEKYFSAYPALKAYPIEILVDPPAGKPATSIRYRLRLVSQ